jgi:DNA (cytosine-5)-methyltransferase 1
MAISYFYNHLHPDSARENGHATTSDNIFTISHLEELDERLIRPIFERSGWPVFLSRFASEAHKRLEKGELTIDEYYSSDIHITGYKHLKKVGKNGKNK